MKPHITWALLCCCLLSSCLFSGRAQGDLDSCGGLETGEMPVRYFYFCFFVAMIVHRALRDEQRCAKKYGATWEKYLKVRIFFGWGGFACGSTATIKVHSCFILTCEKSNIYTGVFLIFVAFVFFVPQGISSTGKSSSWNSDFERCCAM